MSKYALIDSNNNILDRIDVDNEPQDPIGKGWKWIQIVENNVEDPTEGQLVAEISAHVDHDVLYVEKEIIDIPITFNDIDTVVREKLQEIKPFILKTGSTIHLIPSEKTVNNLSSLVTHINIMIENGETHTTLYRDARENNIDMTIEEIKELYQKVFLYNKQVTQVSWLIKDDHNLPKNIKSLREDTRWPI
jgi:hypothetical protein